MVSEFAGRNWAVKILAIGLCVGVGWQARLPSDDASERLAIAQRFSFQASTLNTTPPDAAEIRQVEPKLNRIQSWISAVGAGVALADIDGDGRANDRCLVDPRDNSVSIAPVPGTGERYAPFDLTPSGVIYNARTTAPMGCIAADFNEDGYTDALVYYWGRPPIMFLRRPGTSPAAGSFVAIDIVSDPHEIWNTETVNVADLDGDGHLDLVIGNYFPDGARVLDPSATNDPKMQMQDSMSMARNGGRNRILRLQLLFSAAGITRPVYQDQSGVLTGPEQTGWTLATGLQDLDGDGLPELYIANDFGPDYLLWNRSTPGQIRFSALRGQRDPGEPKSKVLGKDSFKSMGVAFTDINRDGRSDIVVSNITTSYALEESNFAFISTGNKPLTDRIAPYRDQSQSLGIARSGWGWDVKAADFDGDGIDELVQALGFIKGTTNRWPELQELAMGNDTLLHDPSSWPVFRPGTDIAGHQRNALFVADPSGRYVNIADQLKLPQPGVSRGIAIGDVDHDGRPDMAVANQWADSEFLHNTGAPRSYLGLDLMIPVAGTGNRTRPAIGAAVTVVKPDGQTLRQQLYPANGHTGVNAPELLFGLGAAGDSPVTVIVQWRDITGLHTMSRTLDPGWHTLSLPTATS